MPIVGSRSIRERFGSFSGPFALVLRDDTIALPVPTLVARYFSHLRAPDVFRPGVWGRIRTNVDPSECMRAGVLHRDFSTNIPVSAERSACVPYGVLRFPISHSRRTPHGMGAPRKRPGYLGGLCRMERSPAPPAQPPVRQRRHVRLASQHVTSLDRRSPSGSRRSHETIEHRCNGARRCRPSPAPVRRTRAGGCETPG